MTLENSNPVKSVGSLMLDPTPEYRPARADPIDMDDDEKEMIAEARVRLANIKGKKAKRIAREKVLDEARRLAQLQKFRELKSAGIDFVIERKRRKKKHEFNYEDEVPLERQPLEAVFDTKEEKRAKQGDLNLGNITINQLEGRRRDEEELQKRREDLRRVKKLREMDLPNRIQRANALNPMNFIKKRELDLEKPQLGDEDIDELAKLSKRAGNYSGTSLGLKKVKRPTDFLLQDNCMDEIQSIVGQTVTPSTGGDLMAKAREILEVSDPDYVSRQEPLPEQASKDGLSVSSYFTSGLSVKGSVYKGQMDLEQFDKSGAKKTLNPYKELVRNIKNEERDFGTAKKEESVYSVHSVSVMSKLNDHLSINSPWMNVKKIETGQAQVEPSGFQRFRSEWSQMSQKKRRRKMGKLVQAEFDKLPQKGHDFQLDYSDLAEEFELERQTRQDSQGPVEPAKVRIREQEPEFRTKVQQQRRVCAEALRDVVGTEEKDSLRRRIRELEEMGDPESQLEKRTLAMMAEDLEGSEASQLASDDEDIAPEFYENAEVLLAREGEPISEEDLRQVDQEVFTDQFYLERGFCRKLLEQRLEMEHRNKLAAEIKFQEGKAEITGELAKEFEKVKEGVNNSKQVKKVFEIEKKALVLGRMNGMEKTHCLRELKQVEDMFDHLKAVEEDLQAQFESVQINNQHL